MTVNREVVTTYKETDGKATSVTVTPTEVRIKIAQRDVPEAKVVEMDVLDMVERIPNTVPRSLRGDYRLDDGLLSLTSNGGSYGYHFYDGELTAVKFRGYLVYGTGWHYDD